MNQTSRQEGEPENAASDGTNQPSLFDRGQKLKLLNEVPIPVRCQTRLGSVSGATCLAVLRGVDDAIGKNSSWSISYGRLAKYTKRDSSTVRRAVAALETDVFAKTLIAEGIVAKEGLPEYLDPQSWALLSVIRQYRAPKGRSASDMQVLWSMLKALNDSRYSFPEKSPSRIRTKRAVAPPLEPVAPGLVVRMASAGSAHGAQRGSAHPATQSSAHGAHSLPAHHGSCPMDPAHYTAPKKHEVLKDFSSKDALHVDFADLENLDSLDRLFPHYANACAITLSEHDRFQFYCWGAYVARRHREGKCKSPGGMFRTGLMAGQEPDWSDGEEWGAWSAQITQKDEERVRGLIRHREASASHKQSPVLVPLPTFQRVEESDDRRQDQASEQQARLRARFGEELFPKEEGST